LLPSLLLTRPDCISSSLLDNPRVPLLASPLFSPRAHQVHRLQDSLRLSPQGPRHRSRRNHPRRSLPRFLRDNPRAGLVLNLPVVPPVNQRLNPRHILPSTPQGNQLRVLVDSLRAAPRRSPRHSLLVNLVDSHRVPLLPTSLLANRRANRVARPRRNHLAFRRCSQPHNRVVRRAHSQRVSPLSPQDNLRRRLLSPRGSLLESPVLSLRRNRRLSLPFSRRRHLPTPLGSLRRNRRLSLPCSRRRHLPTPLGSPRDSPRVTPPRPLVT
jgi:hypothetical protein